MSLTLSFLISQFRYTWSKDKDNKKKKVKKLSHVDLSFLDVPKTFTTTLFATYSSGDDDPPLLSAEDMRTLDTDGRQTSWKFSEEYASFPPFHSQPKSRF